MEEDEREIYKRNKERGTEAGEDKGTREMW